jgi:predicted RNA binding protein YcfA (HicA-like mRNA interferase family)
MPSEVRFTVVRKMLERGGWTFARVTGSHHVFTKPGKRPLVIAVHGNKVQPGYVREVEKILRDEGSQGPD